MSSKIHHAISIVITIGVLLLAFNFTYSFIRIYDVILDFFNCLGYFANETFGTSFKVNLNIIDKVYDLFDFWFPLSFETLKSIIKDYFKFIFNERTLDLFYYDFLDFMTVFLKVMLIVLPFLVVFKMLLENIYFTQNENDPDSNSKQLVKFKNTFVVYYSFVKKKISLYFDFLKDKKFYLIIWVLLFSFYFNFISIIIHFISYYLYFVVSFDIVNLYIFAYKILFDLMPMFLFIPWPVWIILGLFLFNFIRKNIAMSIFHHYENRNKGFINSLGQVTMICGPTGTSKTLTMTDMLLSTEMIFRDKALEKLLGYDNMFPNFPYISLENEIQRAFYYHEIYNLASAKKWILKKIRRSYEVELIDNQPVLKFKKDKLFGYDLKKYPLIYFNGYKEIHLFDMLENYTKVYLVYVVQSSLIVSNYAIRSDNYFDSLGNFPFWHSGFFNTNPDYVNNISRYSHILDFDALRLLKKVKENNKVSVDFGVFGITEIGKERGNQIDHRTIKVTSEEANQLNDGFNPNLKIKRHDSTVDNYAFLKIFLDDQRAESLGADAREQCEKIIYIKNKSDYQNPLILFRLEYMIYSLIKNKWEDIYKTYRYYRSDNTLLFYILKNIYSAYQHYIDRLYNKFGFFVSTLSAESGTLDGNAETNKYYLMFSKIYSNRYATDCFSDFFYMKNINSNNGLNDLKEYECEKATIEELASQNSYFINDLLKHNK